MRKKSVTGPFWTMLIIGCITALYYYAVGRPRIAGDHLRPLTLFFFILWPILLFSESVFYWMVRKRILYIKQAWLYTRLHTSCMLFCFVLYPMLRALIFLYINEFVSISERRRVVPVISPLLVVVYWASIILGHVFFGMVVKRILAKPGEPSTPPDNENVNLLDDVLN